ncbi:MAG: phosphoglycerate dehydrogenase [Selenomonadaceae bacterium]|nr:phosphoglycerate dehydrogenase [Selenomonadaceae bacterium]MBQ7723423.1 phosphoglycerate dehydrogenase [Selenomonadaceae bacterium]
MNTFNILAADGIANEGIEQLRKTFNVEVRDKISHEELLEIIPKFDALIVRSASKVTADVLERGTNLKIIGRAGVGVDNIDIQAATERGIIVINSPDGNTIAATEHTFAMMLAVSRNIPQANQIMHAGGWDRKKFVGVELRNKTLAIIGLGKIGAGVAKRAQSFDMNVIAYDPFVSAERAKNLGVTMLELDELFRRADFITVHMPLTNKTRDMISLEQMKIMKPTVRLINCARGGIINEADLATALTEKIIAGAAIDVFENEPLAEDSPLRNLPNIILTPHLGASTVEAQIGVSVDVAKGIIDALNNRPVATAVNLPHIPSHVLEKLAPYLDLAERLGRTITGMSKEPISSVQVKINGKIADMNSSLISTAVLKGMLATALDTNVNLVNANILAAERGIHLSEIKSSIARDFANLVTVSANGNIVTGTLFGNDGRIVEINNFRVDVDPHARILICPHINRPGVIGLVGTLLAKHGVNISGMQVGKTAIEGTSLMVLTVDNPISQHVLADMKNLEPIFDVTPVAYDV